METFYLTDTGIVRDHNEDSVIIVENGDATLLAVADGSLEYEDMLKWVLEHQE